MSDVAESAFRRMKQEDYDFEASMGNIGRPYLKRQNKMKQKGMLFNYQEAATHRIITPILPRWTSDAVSF